MEENHAYSEIIGSANAPYINSLASQSAVFTQSFAITHPSQPNYLDIFSGSNQGVIDDSAITQTFTTPNLGASLIQAGLTFASYAEGLPSVGSTTIASGVYVSRHNPCVDWQGAQANAIPAADNQPFTSFPTDFSTLPTVSFVIPNLQDDMHDGTVAMGDTWLQNNLDSYVQWAKTHNSLLIVTFDEDDPANRTRSRRSSSGRWSCPAQYGETINHFSVLRTIEDMYGLPYAGASATATPITDVWQTSVATSLVVRAPSSTTAGRPSASPSPHRRPTTWARSTSRAAMPSGGAPRRLHLHGRRRRGAYLPRWGDPEDGGPSVDHRHGQGNAGPHRHASGHHGRPGRRLPAGHQRPDPVNAGAPFNLTVTAFDPYGNRAASYAGTVHFSRPKPPLAHAAVLGKAVLPADYRSRPATPGCISSPARCSSMPGHADHHGRRYRVSEHHRHAGGHPRQASSEVGFHPDWCKNESALSGDPTDGLSREIHHSPLPNCANAPAENRAPAASSASSRAAIESAGPRAASITVWHSSVSMNRAASSRRGSSPGGIARKPCLSAWINWPGSMVRPKTSTRSPIAPESHGHARRRAAAPAP